MNALRNHLLAVLYVGLLALVGGGCGDDAAEESGVLRDEVVRGPLEMRVEVRPAKVLLGDPVEVRVLVHAPEDHVVQFPPPEAFEGWTVAEAAEPQRLPAPEGGLDWRRRYVLEKLEAGEHEIAGLSVSYAVAADDASEDLLFEHELASDGLTVTVRSALTTQDSVGQPRDITGVLRPELTFWERTRGWWLTLVGAVVTVALVLILLRVLVRRQRTKPPIPPEVWAMRRLDALRPETVEAGAAREFYYELSEVVREYIEKKFAVAAPEMTTEEFFHALARDHSSIPYDEQRLREFMQACDIVKYAAFDPRREDAEDALRTGRAFVNETAAAAAARVGAVGGERSESGVGAA